MTGIKESKSLLDVWGWKESAYQEVADLPLDEALEKRIEDSIKMLKKLGFSIKKSCEGDYTKDRSQWLDKISLEKILEQVNKQRDQKVP